MASGSCSTRSGHGRTRHTAIASTTSLGHSRWTCSTGRTLGWAAVEQSAWRGLRFLDDAFDASSGRFRNFRSIDGSWIGGLGSDDSYGRAVLSLGDTIATAPDRELVDAAAALIDQALPAARELTSPRAEASVVLGCAAILDSSSGRTPGRHAHAPRDPTARPVPAPLDARLAVAGSVGDVRERPAPARADRRRPGTRVGADGRLLACARSTGSSTPRPRPTGISRRSGTSGGRETVRCPTSTSSRSRRRRCSSPRKPPTR